MDNKQIIKKSFVFLILCFLLFSSADFSFAFYSKIIFYQKGDIQIENPEISQSFYDELQGQPRNYFIESEKDFNLYLNLLVPHGSNSRGRYSANVYFLNGQNQELVIFLDGDNFEWTNYYKELIRDYYLKGPELDINLKAGKYKIEVFSAGPKLLPQNNENQEENIKTDWGKYVLVIGKEEIWNISSVLNVCWQIPLLKITFFKSDVLQFFLTPFGIGIIAFVGAILIFSAFIYFIIGLIKEIIRQRQAKTLLLTSTGMRMKDEIKKLLQKPAYDITVGFITTAAKPEEDLSYVKKDWEIMRDEMGFNVEEIDIDGKTEPQVMQLLRLKDIIYIEGGNTFYLLNSMRKCGFERIMKKLLKLGKVYIGVSAGSIVAGRTIKTAGWKNGDKNIVNIKNLKGLNLVPFDIFVHYQPEHAEIIKEKMPWKWQRRKLKIITDDQAILVQGKEVILIGQGEAVNI